MDQFEIQTRISKTDPRRSAIKITNNHDNICDITATNGSTHGTAARGRWFPSSTLPGTRTGLAHERDWHTNGTGPSERAPAPRAATADALGRRRRTVYRGECPPPLAPGFRVSGHRLGKTKPKSITRTIVRQPSDHGRVTNSARTKTRITVVSDAPRARRIARKELARNRVYCFSPGKNPAESGPVPAGAYA